MSDIIETMMNAIKENLRYQNNGLMIDWNYNEDPTTFDTDSITKAPKDK